MAVIEHFAFGRVERASHVICSGDLRPRQSTAVASRLGSRVICCSGAELPQRPSFAGDPGAPGYPQTSFCDSGLDGVEVWGIPPKQSLDGAPGCSAELRYQRTASASSRGTF